MNHLCASCEHSAGLHPPQGCEQPCIDPDTGDIFTCPCPRFVKDTDD